VDGCALSETVPGSAGFFSPVVFSFSPVPTKYGADEIDLGSKSHGDR
jgi:hypothetical protein